MKINTKSKPAEYMACTSTNCPQASTCLRAWAWNHTDDDPQVIRVVNPKYAAADGNCRYYCSNAPQRFARGFAHFQKRMFPDQYDKFCSACIQRFGRNPYFMRRRGDTLMSPSEQQFIRSLLKKIGAPEDLDFTAYELRWNWNND